MASFEEACDLRPAELAEGLNPILDSFQHHYTHYKPHGVLARQTPAAYLSQRQAAVIQPSHMC